MYSTIKRYISAFSVSGCERHLAEIIERDMNAIYAATNYFFRNFFRFVIERDNVVGIPTNAARYVKSYFGEESEQCGNFI